METIKENAIQLGHRFVDGSHRCTYCGCSKEFVQSFQTVCSKSPQVRQASVQHQKPDSASVDSEEYISVDEYAVEHGLTKESVIQKIRDAEFVGRLIDNQWYLDIRQFAQNVADEKPTSAADQQPTVKADFEIDAVLAAAFSNGFMLGAVASVVINLAPKLFIPASGKSNFPLFALLFIAFHVLKGIDHPGKRHFSDSEKVLAVLMAIVFGFCGWVSANFLFILLRG